MTNDNLNQPQPRSFRRAYWQPPRGATTQQCLAAIEAVTPWLKGLHVFHWSPKGARLPLAEGRLCWQQYFSRASAAGDCDALLEFVRDNSPEILFEDAAALNENGFT